MKTFKVALSVFLFTTMASMAFAGNGDVQSAVALPTQQDFQQQLDVVNAQYDQAESIRDKSNSNKDWEALGAVGSRLGLLSIGADKTLQSDMLTGTMGTLIIESAKKYERSPIIENKNDFDESCYYFDLGYGVSLQNLFFPKECTVNSASGCYGTRMAEIAATSPQDLYNYMITRVVEELKSTPTVDQLNKDLNDLKQSEK